MYPKSRFCELTTDETQEIIYKASPTGLVGYLPSHIQRVKYI